MDNEKNFWPKKWWKPFIGVLDKWNERLYGLKGHSFRIIKGKSNGGQFLAKNEKSQYLHFFKLYAKIFIPMAFHVVY